MGALVPPSPGTGTADDTAAPQQALQLVPSQQQSERVMVLPQQSTWNPAETSPLGSGSFQHLPDSDPRRFPPGGQQHSVVRWMSRLSEFLQTTATRGAGGFNRWLGEVSGASGSLTGFSPMHPALQPGEGSAVFVGNQQTMIAFSPPEELQVHGLGVPATWDRAPELQPQPLFSENQLRTMDRVQDRASLLLTPPHQDRHRQPSEDASTGSSQAQVVRRQLEMYDQRQRTELQRLQQEIFNLRAERDFLANQGVSTHEVPQGIRASSMHEVPQGIRASSTHEVPQGIRASSTHEVPQGTRASSTHEVPQGIRASSTHEVPQGTRASSTHEVPQGIRASSTHEVPQGIRASSTHEVPQGIRASSMHEVPQGIRAPTMHEVPQGIRASSTHEVPQGIRASSTHEVPQGIRASSMHEVPQGIRAPTMHEVPQGIRASSTHEVPQGTRAPTTQEVPQGIRASTAQEVPQGIRASTTQEVPQGIQASSAPEVPHDEQASLGMQAVPHGVRALLDVRDAFPSTQEGGLLARQLPDPPRGPPQVYGPPMGDGHHRQGARPTVVPPPTSDPPPRAQTTPQQWLGQGANQPSSGDPLSLLVGGINQLQQAMMKQLDEGERSPEAVKPGMSVLPTLKAVNPQTAPIDIQDWIEMLNAPMADLSNSSATWWMKVRQLAMDTYKEWARSTP